MQSVAKNQNQTYPQTDVALHNIYMASNQNTPGHHRRTPEVGFRGRIRGALSLHLTSLVSIRNSQTVLPTYILVVGTYLPELASVPRNGEPATRFMELLSWQ